MLACHTTAGWGSAVLHALPPAAAQPCTLDPRDCLIAACPGPATCTAPVPQAYRDGGMGALRPVIIRLGGEPVPGICEGLNRGIAGMRVGGRRTFAVPPALGFGSGMVLGPYGELSPQSFQFLAGQCLHDATWCVALAAFSTARQMQATAADLPTCLPLPCACPPLAGVVPGGSEVRYEVELLRLSRQGPDALMSGVSQCGGGVASERTSGCAAITPAEFV